ncbi:MAG: rane protein [Gammaproteobacteria bacterium]|nr:rane protein [Gammaproteobacteria bacterium]
MKFINTGILLMLLVAFYQSLMSAIVKAVSPEITTGIEVLAYYAIPLAFLLPLLFKKGLQEFKTDQLPFFFIRGGLSTAAVFCFFYASEHINLGVAAVLFNTVPIFIPLMALIFLNEKTHPLTYLAIIISLLGVVLVINPGVGEFFTPASLIGMASGILMAASQVMLRHLAKNKISVDKIVFYQYLTSSIASLLIIGLELLLFHHSTIFRSIPSKNWLFIIVMLLLLGLISIIAQRTLTKAFHHLPAALLAPFLYVSVPISSLLGWIIWQQRITEMTMLGCFLVILGGCMITYISFKFHRLAAK